MLHTILTSISTTTGANFFSSFLLCEGRIFSDAALPGLRPTERAAVYESAAETLARLHRVDFVRAGLEGFGRAKGGYLGRQVATLERVAAKQVCGFCVHQSKRSAYRLGFSESKRLHVWMATLSRANSVV